MEVFGAKKFRKDRSTKTSHRLFWTKMEIDLVNETLQKKEGREFQY